MTLRTQRGRIRPAVLITAILAITLYCQSQNRPASVADPTYVTIHLHCETPDDDVPQNPNLPRALELLKSQFGPQSAGNMRYVGFSPGLIFTLNLPPAVLQARITQALDLAEQNSIPVFFHLDDMHFWYKNPEVIRDPEAVEWSAFPKKGEASGPIVQRYWLNWGSWVVFPAPPPCFESPKFRALVADRLTKRVAGPIVERLKRWKAKGKEHLFAGIGIGNETQVPDYRLPRGGREPEGLDTTRKPPAKVRFSRNEMVRTGYHALHLRGYTEASIQRLAKEKGKSVDAVTTDILYQVAHDYAEFNAKTLNEAGVPRERLYTHFTSPFRPFLEKMTASRPAFLGTAGSAALPPPVWSAVNPYSRPGFTVAPDAVDFKDLTTQILQARGTRSVDFSWAAVETYATTGQLGGRPTREPFENYLTHLFSNGAKLATVYALDPTATEALRAIGEWRSGKKEVQVTESSSPTDQSQPQDPRPPIATKVEKIKQAIERLQKNGKNIDPVVKKMEEFGTLLNNDRLEEAGKVLDQVLKLLDEAEREVRKK